MSDVTPKTESGRALRPDEEFMRDDCQCSCGCPLYKDRTDGLCDRCHAHALREQEAASEAVAGLERLALEAADAAVAEVLDRLEGNLGEFRNIHGDPLPWEDVDACFASERIALIASERER